jgi:DNA-binding NtrC family response regulator
MVDLWELMDPTIIGTPRPIVQGGTMTVAGGRGSVEIGTAPCVVGRDPSCQLVLDDKRASATHLELVATEHGLRVRDLGSTNGTYLGEHRIVEVLLNTAAVIRCGDTLLEYEPGKPEAVALASEEEFGPLVGGTPHMRALFARLRKLARTDLSVLILGETGTGKELVAKAIHQASERAHKPFVVVDCGTIPPTLVEGTLFGHEKGAFTGADQRRMGVLAEADAGTLFLDELGELPLDVQPKLLRALAEQKIRPVGSTRYSAINVRVVAATWRDLPREINRGSFRSDLFFRIADERFVLPPLRERLDDLPLLITRMMTEFGKAEAFDRVTPESLNRLVAHTWPGNVRELRALVRRALAYDEGGAIDLGAYLCIDGPRSERGGAGPKLSESTYEQSKEEHDRSYFAALFEASLGNISEMSRRAGVNRETVRQHLRRHGIGDRGG